MDPEVRKEYNDIIARVAASAGTVLLEKRISSFIQYDYRLSSHLATCEMRSFTAVDEDSTWYEFQGTFADDHSVHGVEVSGVNCACGKIIDRTIRWQASISDVTTAVFAEMARRLEVLGRRIEELNG